MLDFHAASDRAVRYAIQTGEMPNMHLIHALQRGEGYTPCFGRSVKSCTQTHCRWFAPCTALYEFDPTGNNSHQPTLIEPSRPEQRSVSISVLGVPLKPTGGKLRVPKKRVAEREPVGH